MTENSTHGLASRPGAQAVSDIVERLRAWHTPGETVTGDVQLYLDAADEIERLNKEGSDLAVIIRQQGLEVDRLRAENEQLRAINKDIGVALGVAAAQTKPDLRALLPELAVIRQVMKDPKP